MGNPFYGRDVVSIKDFARSDLDYLFEITDRICSSGFQSKSKIGEGKILATLFFEPSTRTRLSFEAAMLAIGGHVIGFAEPRVSSVEKGETLVDTIRTVENYADIIVLRHGRDGAARLAAEASEKPIINAGSGSEEHPTQAMIDLYTIRKERGSIEGVRLGIIGDLKYGRTVYSLLYSLPSYNPTVFLISPDFLKIRREAMTDLKEKMQITEHDSISAVIGELDVLYVTRIQKERMKDPNEFAAVKGSYTINLNLLKKGKKDLMVMHPLPRIDEINREVDGTSYAKYFRQVSYGKSVREALLALVLSKSNPLD